MVAADERSHRFQIWADVGCGFSRLANKFGINRFCWCLEVKKVLRLPIVSFFPKQQQRYPAVHPKSPAQKI